MKPSTTSNCPFHIDFKSAPPVRKLHPPGTRPPGPPPGFTGWGLLRRMSRDPLGTFGQWRHRYGDIFHLRIWPEHQVVLTEPQLVRKLLVNHHEALHRWERGINVFAQLHGNSVLIAEGKPWSSKRHALLPSFSPKAMQPSIPVIAAAAADAFSRWNIDEAYWPIESAFTALGMDVILRTLFSSAIDEDARIAERAVHVAAAAGNAEMYWPASWPDWMPWKRTKRQAIAALNGLIGRHIQARLALAPTTWPPDLLSRLLSLHHEHTVAWPLNAVHDECMTAFLAGHETTAATLTWWAWFMAANPEVQSAARQEVQSVLQGRMPTAEDLPLLAYLTQTLQETLRLYPAAPVLMTRRSLRSITLGSWQLPARTLFTIPVQLIHHDPKWFPNPHEYRPERFAVGAPSIPRGAFMPFGTGPRVCLGQHLAMAEMTVVAAMYLQRFVVKVPDGMKVPVPVFNITLRPDHPLHLTLIRNSLQP